jgi:hypothetical protein
VLTNLAFFRARPGQAKALGAALTDLVDPTRREAGSVSYDLHQSFGDASSWLSTKTGDRPKTSMPTCRQRISRRFSSWRRPSSKGISTFDASP